VRLIRAEESVNSRNSPVTAKAVASPQPAGPSAPGANADRARGWRAADVKAAGTSAGRFALPPPR
jgi:hypothetical protein